MLTLKESFKEVREYTQILTLMKKDVRKAHQ